MEKIPVIVIVGPTASGKTSLGVEIAKEVNGEVVSADSMQIYKGMEIASAAPTAEETEGIAHHLIGIFEPTERFSVAEYCNKAAEIIADIHKRGKTPIIVGGTGFYIDSLIGGLSFSEEENEEVRSMLEARAEAEGIEALYRELAEKDREKAEKLPIGDKKRIIRALEKIILHGKTATEQEANALNKESPYSAVFIGLNFSDREILYSRIEKRIDLMLKNGLTDEAYKTYQNGISSTAVQAIGHKELYPYFEGKISLSKATENLKTATRHYAKRQLTWFRRNKEINWIYPDITPDVFCEAMKILK